MNSEVVVFQGIVIFYERAFFPVAILIQDWLYLRTLQINFGLGICRGNTSFISSIIVISGITSISAEESVMCSDSALISEIYVCSELRQ